MSILSLSLSLSLSAIFLVLGFFVSFSSLSLISFLSLAKIIMFLLVKCCFLHTTSQATKL